MTEWIITEDITERQTQLESDGYDAYCLRTKTGWETDAANHINLLNENVLALPFMKLSHKSSVGIKSVEQKTVLPSYVFLFTPKGYLLENLNRKFREGFAFVYYADEDDILLRNGDLRYARWVFSSTGIIGMSRAIKVNGKVKIIDGPLLSLEGQIKEYSKKNRNCRIETVLFNRVISVWLPFTYIEEIKD